jgi:DeoR/GlpR family transcriptional regulator of sugar metabolism
VMTDADALEAEVKRTMIAQAGEATLLVDRSKLGVRGLSVVASVGGLANVLAAGVSEDEAGPLRAAGAQVRVLG